MPDRETTVRALLLAVVTTTAAVAGAATLAGGVTAATNVSIQPGDDAANATGVTYTADGAVEVSNQDTLQHVDVHLGPADVSDVGSADVSVYIDGTEYTDGLTQFDAGGGTVEFKLSNSQAVSDGDPVRVVVADVDNPAEDFDATTTLHDTGDDRWQTYADTVTIDSPADISYSGLQFADEGDGSDTTVDVGEPLDVSATVENTGEQSGDYNASLVVDGTVRDYQTGTVPANAEEQVTFTTDFDATGSYDVSVENLSATEVTVTGSLAIAGGAADPASVESGTTVTNQRVVVDVADVSQDGDTDTHYVEFPNALADGLSVNGVDANATSITSSPNLVDGYDNDGVDDTVKFATSGDDGADKDLRLTVDADVSYPDTETTYGIDARTEDSDGETATAADVATITAQSTPTITDFEAATPSGREVSVSFNSTEPLVDINATITDSSGAVLASLTESDFSESSESGTWTYETTTTVDQDGDLTVTLEKAVDDDGSDAAEGQTRSVRVDTVDAAIEDGSADPESVAPGTTVDNQKLSVVLSGVSADGDTDRHFVELPNDIASGLSVNYASVNGSASIAQSAQLVDGYDGDGVDDTVRFQTDTDAGGTIPLDISVDVSVDYPDEAAVYYVDARTEDSDGDVAQQSDVTAIRVGQNDPPVITDFTVTNPTDRVVRVAFDSDEALSSITVDLSDSDGTTVATLTESDFTESDSYHYVAETSVDSDDTYTGTLTEATDAEGNDGADDQSDTATVDAGHVAIVDGSASPSSVLAGQYVSNQELTVTVANVSQDGNTDWHYVTVPNDLAADLVVNGVDANATSITSSPNLVDGGDGDGVADTVKFATSGDDTADIDLRLTVDVDVDYPDRADTYGIDARVEDSTGDGDAASVATVTASESADRGDQTAPDVTDFAVTSEMRTVSVGFDSTERLAAISVTLTRDGETVATLNESAFTERDGWHYEANTTVESDGTYTATLTEAADDAGNDGADGQTDATTVETPVLRVVAGSADPVAVTPGTTVDTQRVSAVVANVSRDGDTDWYYVQFPDALAEGLSPNYAGANATAISSSIQQVDGFDDDGVAETLRFATSATGGGHAPLRVFVDTGVAYPEGERSYPVAIRVEDSCDCVGNTTAPAATVEASAAPVVTGFDLENPEGRTLTVAFDSSDPLSNVSVDLDAGDGTSVATLSAADFTEYDAGDGVTYRARTTVESDGTYTATLTEATDADGDAAAGQSDSATVDTAHTAIVGGEARPAEVRPDATRTDQTFAVVVADVSSDGEADTHYVELPNTLADGLAVESASANATSVAAGPALVDGFDDDGVAETVRFETAGDAGGARTLRLTVTASVTYPDAEAVYAVDARTVDSDGETATDSGVTSVVADGTPVPDITRFEATSPEDRDVEVMVGSDEPLTGLRVVLTNASDGRVTTFSRTDFTETSDGTAYTYGATGAVDRDGVYTATLVEATDAAGNDAANDQDRRVVVDTSNTTIRDGAATPATVSAGETVNNQRVGYTVANLSLDGDTDVHFLTVPNALASGLSVNGVSLNATSVTASPELVDGPDDDGVADTVRFATSGDGGGGATVRVTVDTAVAYPAGNATYGVDVRVVDSLTGPVGASDAARIEAVDPAGDGSDTGPPVCSVPDASEITDARATDDGHWPRATMRVTADDPAAVDLTLADTMSVGDGGVAVYAANLSTRADGIAVDLTGTVGVGAAAVPPWTGVDRSAHTVVTPVAADSGLAGDALQRVELDYASRFSASGGSLAAVDEGAVPVLQVVSANGTVEARLGGTDALSVTAEDGTATVDLSNVSADRVPTLSAGDRVVVQIRPVANPLTIGQYGLTTTVESAAGNTVQSNASVGIRARLAVDAVAALATDDAARTASLSATARDDCAMDDLGVTTVRVHDALPADAAPIGPPVVSALNVTRPASVAEDSLDLSVAVSPSDFEGNESALQLRRYDAETDRWVTLNTTVEAGPHGVTVSATPEETSLFAVVDPTAPGGTGQQDPSDDGGESSDGGADTRDDEHSPTVTESPGDGTAVDRSSFPVTLGVGALLGLLAVTGLGIAALRRYR